jgi:CBS domain-containing protein
VGYLVAGALLRIVLVQLLLEDAGVEHARDLPAVPAEPLQPIKTLALGLILFVIGGVFERSHVQSVGRRILRISLVEIVTVLLLVAIGCTLAMLAAGTVSFGEAVSCGTLLGALGIATAPAATLLVLREYQSKGRFSDTILSLTAINNVACIAVFHGVFLLLASLGLVETLGDGTHFAVFDLFVTTVGSVVLGVALGFLISILFAKTSLTEFILILLGVMLALGQGGRFLADTFHVAYSFLLTSLAMGAAFANVAVDQDRLHDGLTGISGPIFSTFFVLAGYELHLSEVEVFGLAGIAYVVLRISGKAIGGYVGRRWADPDGEMPAYVGLGLLCQAGVAIGLVDFLVDTWGTMEVGGFVVDPLAHRLHTIVVGSVVVFELAGPLVLKSTVVRSGEVKAITLLRRHQAPAVSTASATRLAWEAMVRALGLRRPSSVRQGEPVKVKHIMRSNIRLLKASAGFDEVLHFVESSRYNDFPVAGADGVLIGMVHFSELRKMMYDPVLRDLVTAMDLADAGTPVVPVDLPLEDLLEVFQEANTGLLPVVESAGSRKIVGLVEQRDLLRSLPRGQKGR